MKRWLRGNGAAVAFLLFSVFWLVIAVADGRIDSAFLAVGYLIVAALRFLGIPERKQEQSRKRLEAKYATQAIPAQPDEPPRWFSPDNPPGWYLNPATREPAYWSELGWRKPAPT
ncbi:MAG TPA: hypothetical protein VGL72_16835 [Bryobacteraceae bacterium]|jgi:hypothetical protein